MRDYKTSRFKKTIGITEKNLNWVKKHKGKKSSAGYLEMIINKFIKDDVPVQAM